MGNLDRLVALYNEGRYQEATDLYRQAPRSGDALWHLYGGLSVGQLVPTQADRKAAGNLLHEARLACERGLQVQAEISVTIRLHFVIGETYRQLGQYVEAILHFETLFQVWQRHDEYMTLLEGAAWHNVGLAHYGRRDYEKAAVCALRAADHFLLNDKREHYARAMRNYAWALCGMGSSTQAGEALDAVENMSNDGGEHFWHQQIGRAYVAYVMQDHAKALATTEFIITQDRAPSDVMAHAAWLSARSYLGKGDLTAANIMASVCMDWAIRVVDARLMNDAQAIQREVRAQRQQGA